MLKKSFVLLLAVLMAMTVCSAALAEGVTGLSEAAANRSAYKLMEEAWAPINAVDAEMRAHKAAPAEVVMACYKAAVNNPLVDEGSVYMDDDNGFQFTVDGMANAYDYRIRTNRTVKNVTEDVMADVLEAAAVKAEANGVRSVNTSTSLNVLLIGPMYSSDSSFTNQYQNEGTTLNNYTGGTYTKLLNENATATAICNAFPNNGIIIFDSHGASYYSTSYLCLCTSTGISSSDYSKRWALNFGDGETYGIDGRFIANHSTGTFPNNFVWMAICEGMKTSVFGTQFLAKGSGAVYGYSQSVTFTWDYKCEKAFWTKMKSGATIATSITYMRQQCGNVDPYGSDAAYPVVMSAVDSYPSNPDSVQTVNCDWVMPKASLLYTAVTGVSVSPTSASTILGLKVQLTGTVNPPEANSYTETWTSSKPNVATVDANGLVTPVSLGTTTITYKVVDTNTSGQTHTYTATAQITVADGEPQGDMYKLVNSASELGAGDYVIAAEINGELYALSSETGSVSNSLGYIDVTSKLYTPASGTYIVEPAIQNVFTFAAKSVGYTIAQNGTYVNASSSANNLTMSSSSVVWYPSDYEGGVMLQRATSTGRFMGMRYNGSYYFYQAFELANAGTDNYFASLKLFKKVGDEPVYHTVTFKDWNGTTLKTEQVVDGGAATAPANPSREGYTFTGWDKAFNNVTTDLVVNAVYSVNSYTLTIHYQYADGTQAAPNYTGSYNYGASYSVTSPVIAGYTASPAIVEGTMGAANVQVTVTYNAQGSVMIGDVNGDGYVTFADVSELYTFLIYGTEVANPAAADVDGNGSIGFEDVSSLYVYLIG